MGALIRDLQPDIIHLRSRMPAWITHLALKTLSPAQRPVVVSTFHGMYSVNAYSAIMAKANQVIAVSNCVRDYVLEHFAVPEARLTVIQRGVDIEAFRDRSINEQWQRQLYSRFPQLAGKRIVMMPGRISRWKGQLDFLSAMARIVRHRPDCHGIIVGGAEPGKERFLQELERERSRLGLTDRVTFLGQRNDMANLYLLADVVCHMSTKPEPFGRTVTEALASGTPVVAYHRGGAAETLQACFPRGLVTPDDTGAFARAVLALIEQPRPAIDLPQRFLLEAQTESTLQVYQHALAGSTER
jgi:glycosyltransferase involved in cell wall biosynthesis